MNSKYDMPYAGVTALLVMGTILNAFSAAMWFFQADSGVALTFGLLGVGFWLLALAIFYFCMSDPSPRHGKRR